MYGISLSNQVQPLSPYSLIILEKILHCEFEAVKITTLGVENLSNKLFFNRWNADLIDTAEEIVSILELKTTVSQKLSLFPSSTTRGP